MGPPDVSDSVSSFHKTFSVCLASLVVLSAWGGIIALVWEPNQVATGWTAELPNASAAYFPEEDQSAAPGMIKTRSELRRPTIALRNSYVSFFFVNAVLGGIAELFFFLSFERTFLCLVMIWSVAGACNTGAVGAPNGKFLRDFLQDLGNRESEVLKLLEMDLMFQLYNVRMKRIELENKMNATDVPKKENNGTSNSSTVLLHDELSKLEAEAVADLTMVASKVAGLKHKNTCYSERGCPLTRYYSCIYCVSILSTMVYVIVFVIALYTCSCGISYNSSNDDDQESINDDFDAQSRRGVVLRPHNHNKHAKGDPGDHRNSKKHPTPKSDTSLDVSASPSAI